MKFKGRNFDVITGGLALSDRYLLAKRKSYATGLAIFYSITGNILLLLQTEKNCCNYYFLR